uniref:MarR family transcriptional regulator n=1 Tax=Fundidesulfovibrio putealis TaxID=270496 RepID=A0A7C3W8M4_9BACT
MAFECCKVPRHDPRTIGLSVYEVSRAWRARLDERLKPLGISTSMWTVVWHLAMADEPLTQSALADAVSMEGSSLVRLLDRLERDGWVRREAVEGDRRSKRVVLTDKVKDYVEKFHDVARSFADELLAGLPEEHLRQCNEVLLTIKARLESMGEK